MCCRCRCCCPQPTHNRWSPTTSAVACSASFNHFPPPFSPLLSQCLALRTVCFLPRTGLCLLFISHSPVRACKPQQLQATARRPLPRPEPWSVPLHTASPPAATSATARVTLFCLQPWRLNSIPLRFPRRFARPSRQKMMRPRLLQAALSKVRRCVLAPQLTSPS